MEMIERMAELGYSERYGKFDCQPALHGGLGGTPGGSARRKRVARRDSLGHPAALEPDPGYTGVVRSRAPSD